MKKIKIILCIIIIFSFTGCWNYQELNELAIATALAVDKKDDIYEVSILIANSKKSTISSREGESSTIVYSGRGKTISEALKDIDMKSPKQIYIGHLAVIVVNDEIAKEGLLDISDLLLREPESVKRFLLILARGNKAKEIIKILSPLESFPSQNIYSNIQISNESQAITTSVTYSKFIENLLKKGINPVLPSVIINGDAKDGSESSSLEKSEPDAEIQLDTIAVFKGDKFLGYTTKDESRGINVINNNINELNITTTCPDEDDKYVVTTLTDLKSNLNIEFIDNKPVITINVKSNGELKELSCDIDLTDPKTIETLEKNDEKNVKNLIEKALKVAQEKYQSDIFGFGNLIYKKNPNFYKKYEDDWDSYFSTIKTKIKVNLNLESKGSFEQSLGDIVDEK